MEQEDNGHVAAICLIQQTNGFAVCPRQGNSFGLYWYERALDLSASRVADDPLWEPGKGICKSEGVNINRGEPLVACADHLDPPCNDVINVSSRVGLACL